MPCGVAYPARVCRVGMARHRERNSCNMELRIFVGVHLGQLRMRRDRELRQLAFRLSHVRKAFR